MQRIDPRLLADAPAFADVRRDLHAHPELGFDVERTAGVVERLLTEWGIPVATGIGGSGVVGIVKKGSSSRAVGLRADMDALPIQEDNTFPHASRIAGRMHACGHDGHTAMLLAAAKHLAAHASFDGTVYLVFQPAEERGTGALRMVEDGLFERFPMEAILGAHNWPNLPVGAFAVSPGPMMASCNEFVITVQGKGAHAAMPDLAVDPVQPACQIAIALQTIVARNLSPSEAAVLSVTMLSAGETIHVIPNAATLKGTVRTYSDATTAFIAKRIEALASGIAAAHGAEAKTHFVTTCAPTVNDDAEAAFVRDALGGHFGAEAVRPFTPSMAAEDFSFMLKAQRGCYFMIGNGEGGHRDGGHGMGPCVLHNPSYDFNDALIPIGAQAWVAIAERRLAPATAARTGRRRAASN
jgi:hippurate hydrolase